MNLSMYKKAEMHPMIEKTMELILHIGLPIIVTEVAGYYLERLELASGYILIIKLALVIVSLILSAFLIVPLIYLAVNYRLFRFIKKFKTHTLFNYNNKIANEDFNELLKTLSIDNYHHIVQKIKDERKFKELLPITDLEIKYNWFNGKIKSFVLVIPGYGRISMYNQEIYLDHKNHLMLLHINHYIKTNFLLDTIKTNDFHGTSLITFSCFTGKLNSWYYFTDATRQEYGVVVNQAEFLGVHSDLKKDH
ncbi:hypothetical protein [Spiroplasma eriocheiris]|uniref:Transmembrane protein n=1 Tax=Spiroplasma eriocheiris TaxID=315358 RepID=A0A0H3XI59_9MOLU|nr:hypothetical protein [Spiroplasma eriocheiris]AHF57679.1 hypothetical protein SPE_0551 [Spiroplasma eriocheiris CCTCC M 207170]AKM54130.1 hypothetical protein SERIO_v1c05580 [Spiroplasma eriocheiris]